MVKGRDVGGHTVCMVGVVAGNTENVGGGGGGGGEGGRVIWS